MYCFTGAPQLRVFDALIANSCVSSRNHDLLVGQHERAELLSSVKPTTPLPTVSTSIVAAPYTANPAATWFEPGCRNALCVGVGAIAGTAQHREDRADRDVDVEVGRAVERIVEQQELAFRDSGWGSGTAPPSPPKPSRRAVRPTRSPPPAPSSR